MSWTGIISQASGESKLDGILLAISGDSNPFGEATNFLVNRGIRGGHRATVFGSRGKLGTEDVIFMVDAVAAPLPQAVTMGAAKTARKKRPAKGPSRKTAGKSAKKAARASKKSSKAAKKSSKKSSKAAKKSSKKSTKKGSGK